MDYLPRTIDRQLSELMATIPIVLLDGARATGKTTTAARYATTEFRFPRDLELVESDPARVLTEAVAPILIDEWQLAGSDLLWALKEIVDADPRPGRFLLTGSVAPESYGPTYPLTGRAVHLTMQPMTRCERDGNGAAPTWLERLLMGDLANPGKRFRVMPVEDMLVTGFPAVRHSSNSPAWLRTYAGTVAERSVEDRRDPVRVARLMRVLAESEGLPVPDEHLWRTADINRATLTSYLHLLTRTHIRADLPAWDSNRIKRITRYPKRLYGDAALALALARIGPADLGADPALAGRYLESFVAAQLRPECERLGASMFHVRTKAGEHEIDLLIESDDGLVAIEVKAGVQPKPADARHLTWLRERLGDRVLASVVLHRGEATFELADGVWAIPVASLFTGR